MFSRTANAGIKTLCILWFFTVCLVQCWRKGYFLHEQFSFWNLIFSRSRYKVGNFAFLWDFYYVKLLSDKLVENPDFVKQFSLYSWVLSQQVWHSCIYISEGSGNSVLFLYIYLYKKDKYLCFKSQISFVFSWQSAYLSPCVS